VKTFLTALSKHTKTFHKKQIKATEKQRLLLNSNPYFD